MKYCVFDSHYGDFIENFKTIKEAKNYCFNLIECNKNYFHSYVIGKWESNDINNEAYKKLFSITYDKYDKKLLIKAM